MKTKKVRYPLISAALLPWTAQLSDDDVENLEAHISQSEGDLLKAFLGEEWTRERLISVISKLKTACHIYQALALKRLVGSQPDEN